jgi:hypothetical protein
MHDHTHDLVIALAADNFIDNLSTGSFISDHTSVFCSFRTCLPPFLSILNEITDQDVKPNEKKNTETSKLTIGLYSGRRTKKMIAG